MAVAAPPEPDRKREPYLGEKRNYLRDGYGTYVFENNFFRYEGEWLKGKKHGHGKLSMKDGTYYEGQFLNGEINGQGYKYFASSKARYTGQFLNGEMHGHGIMNYKNGNCYEGQWYKNKKQGFGVLRTGIKSVYEGSFTNHVRDGEGTQSYDPTYQKLSNGDRFEGFWVMDQRHGQGELWCADGSHYVGGFQNDVFNGEGRMTHASGVVYQGIWKNGYPEIMATKLHIVVEESPLVIRQDKPFSIRVECRDDEDKIIPEMGREIQVMAAFKYKVPKEGSALFDVIEDVADKPITTPFYDVVPYPLTDQPAADNEEHSEGVDSKLDAEAEDKGEEEAEDDGADAPTREVTEVHVETSPPVAEPDSGALPLHTPQEPGLNPASPPASPGEESPQADVNDDSSLGKDGKPDVVSTLASPAATQLSNQGICEWKTLQLAPPPPMYRPFAILEEEKGEKKSRIQKMREKIDHDSSDSEGNALQSRREHQQIGGLTKLPKDPEFINLMEEKVARAGEYVLIVNDVTNPPFLGLRLPSAHLLLKLKRPKKIVVKKPKIKK